ncbi:hypothetical protein VTI74DRAFT_7113 [Chaetomium olivicolor]
MLSEAFSSWFNSFASCCGSRQKPRSNEPSPRFGSARGGIVVLRDQPAVISPPSAEPVWSSGRAYGKALEREKEKLRLRKSMSRDGGIRKAWFARSSSSIRRLKISGPTNFRHLQSESFQLPPQTSRSRPRRRSFRPIELSIYQPHNRLSPILPYLECSITPPPPVYTANSSRWESSSGPMLANERSGSTMSFHMPRRHARQVSGVSDASMSPPRIPPKSAARVSAAPNTERIVERIASKMLERERLQAEIDSLVERQSIYIGSRPSTVHDMQGFEPMPSIPALPAAAPSFAERLSIEGPRTAPSHATSMTVQEKTLKLTVAAKSQPQAPYSSGQEQDGMDRPLAPPLPLVLRPPLRKKKSFSRVSNWLFQPDETLQGDNSTVSSPSAYITTSPRPIKESDGFYQCVAPPEGLPRTSMETSSSVYTYNTGEDDDSEEDGTKTVPTTTAAWTPPNGSPQVKQGSSSRHTTPVVGAGHFAALGVEGDVGATANRPLSVGVAF